MSSVSQRTEAAVFVIEDDPDHADLIGRALTHVGADFEVQGTGELAIQRLKERETVPDLVFLDVNMPGMSGHEVLRTLRSMERLGAIPVVILTTSDARYDMQESMLNGASQYRTKPSRWPDLLDLIGSMVNRYIRLFNPSEAVAFLGPEASPDFQRLLDTLVDQNCMAVTSPETALARHADVIVHVTEQPMDLIPEWRQSLAWVAVCDQPVNCIKAGYDEVVPSTDEVIGAIELARARLTSRRDSALSQSESVSFAAHAAHDLKGPARRMVQLASILSEETAGLPDATRTLTGMIRSEAKRMHDMVGDMLAFAQDAGHSTSLDVSLDVCVDDALLANRDLIEESECIVRRSPLGYVYGNPSQLTRVFQNLIANAIHYRAEGRPPIIEIRGRRIENGGLAVVVSDNGVGIATNMLQRIFLPLVRASTTTQGTGLGLSIVDRAMKRMGGEVRVAAEVGVGSAFVLRFPSQAVSAAHAE